MRPRTIRRRIRKGWRLRSHRPGIVLFIYYSARWVLGSSPEHTEHFVAESIKFGIINYGFPAVDRRLMLLRLIFSYLKKTFAYRVVGSVSSDSSILRQDLLFRSDFLASRKGRECVDGSVRCLRKNLFSALLRLSQRASGCPIVSRRV